MPANFRRTSRVISATLMCGVIAATMLVGTQSAPISVSATAKAKANAKVTYQRAAVKATNVQRAKRDLGTLKSQKCLQRYANKQAQRMANRNKIFHQNVGKMLRACRLSRVGENVAYGFSSGLSVVKDGWMKSPSHRANILDRRYRLSAVAARQSDRGLWYAAQVFGRAR